jgi:hypothetical protein
MASCPGQFLPQFWAIKLPLPIPSTLCPHWEICASICQGTTVEMTTIQEKNRNQQIIATSRKAPNISFGDPVETLFPFTRKLYFHLSFDVKVEAIFNFPFPFHP